MKVARTVWELVFVNMMICSKYNDKETIGQVQKHARNAFLDVVTCKYLPAVRKAEIALFCFNFSAYRFIYIKYSEIFLYQTDCPQSSSHQIALLWGQFYALRVMGGALSSVRPRI